MDKKRMHAVKWKTLTQHTNYGGLWLQNIGTMNMAYLMKLHKKLMTNSKVLWCLVLKGICVNYGEVDDR